MSWTKNEERLLQEVQNNHAVTAKQNMDNKESFWNIRNDSESGIQEYGFETFQEMEEFLRKYINDEQIALILGAASIKEKALHYKKDHKVEKYVESSVDTGDIPDYVYVF